MAAQPASMTSNAFGQCFETYEVQVTFGPVCGGLGNDPVIVRGMNQLGHTVGHYAPCAGNDKAYVWNGGSSITPLPLGSGVLSSRAYGLNSRGQIVGTKSDTAHRAFLYDDGVVIDLGFLPG